MRIFSAALLAWLVSASLAAAAEPTNILFIIGDDMAWTDYGFMGHRTVKTPHLDRLAREGAVFKNAYVPTSLCRASLATLLTGLYPHEHHICCNNPPQGTPPEAMYHFIQDVPTVPRLLAASGYRSFQTGKFWEGHHERGGFTDGMTIKGRHGDDGLVIGRKTLQPVFDFMQVKSTKPWYVWYAPMLPHQPHNPPERLLKKYAVDGVDPKQAAYWANCEWFDESCGELLAWYEKAGLLKNTLVVYIADNGWIQSTGAGKADQFATRSKNTPYDAGVRCPIILWRPGQIPAAVHDDLVSSIDLAPTILSACGVEPPKSMPGVSLLEVAAGKSKLERNAVFGEIFSHDCVELGRAASGLTSRWMRSGNWKLIVFNTPDGAAELYDLAADPSEQKNLADQHPDVVAQLKGRLDAWWPGK